MGFTELILNTTKDTYINEVSPNTNYGTATSLFLDGEGGQEKIALFGFDKSALPADALVTRILLELEFTAGNGYVFSAYVSEQDFNVSTVTYNNADSDFFNNGESSVDIDGDDIIISGATTVETTISELADNDVFTIAVNVTGFAPKLTLKSSEGGFTTKLKIQYYTPDGDSYKSIQDTYIDAQIPGTPYGSATLLNADSNRAMFFRFEEIPNLANLEITSLKLLIAGSPSSISDKIIDNINSVGAVWSEFSLTFNNAPAINFIDTYEVDGVYKRGFWYRVLDITSSVDGLDAINSTGLAITGDDSVSSRESAHVPYIEVVTAVKPVIAPTLTNPINGQYVDRGVDLTVTWTTDQPQGEYELDYGTDGTAWTTLSGTTEQSRTISGGTFALGDLYFRIRYKPVGSSDWSEYSVNTIVNSVDNPVAPTGITSGSVTTATPTITATATGVLEFTITISDSFGNVFETATVTATSISYDVQNPLIDGVTYDIDITYKNFTGFDSDVGSSSITTAFIKPNTPTVTASTGSHYIELQITNPSGGTAVAYNDVYKIVDNQFSRVATNVAENGTFVDYFAESGKEQAYFIRAYASSGGYAQSAELRETLEFLDAFLITVDTSLGAELILAPERRKSISNEHTTFNFAGRSSSVVLYSGLVNKNLDTFQYEIHDRKILQTLEDMVEYKQTVCYRDARGRKLFLALTGINVADNMPDYFTVVFNSVGVDFNEVV